MIRRLRPMARRCGLAAVAAAAIGIPTFGISPLIGMLAAGALLDASSALVERSDRPELWVIAGWVSGVVIAATSLVFAGGPRLYLLTMFAYPLIVIAVLLPNRVVIVTAVVTCLTMVGLAFLLDGPEVVGFPPTVLYPLTALMVATVCASMAREKDLLTRRTAFRDELTGLLNRAALNARASELAYQARARGEHVAVLVADIDHFKAINDRDGHVRGDVVLAAVATRMRDALVGGSLYRLGGEEFVALLPGATLQQAEEQAERVRQAMGAAPVEGIAVTVSLGVAMSQPPGFDFEAVLAVADEALYRAKRTGRDRVCVADQTQTVVPLRSRAPAQRRGSDTPAAPLAATPAVAAPVATPARVPVADAQPVAGWLAGDRQQRAQLVAFAQRSQLLGLLFIYPCALAAVLGAVPEFGAWIPVPPTIGAAVLVTIVVLLPRLRRPERALAAAWLIAELAAAGGWVVARNSPGQSMLVALPALGLLVAAFSPAFRPRVVALGAAISGALMITVALVYDPTLTLHDPAIVATPLAVMVTLAAMGSTLGRSTVDHLGVGVVDELTGMLNRTALRARTAEIETETMRAAPITLIVGDLDELKRINDEHGHAAGDAVLREVSRRVRRELRAFDTVYRIGGDEFVALLTALDEDAQSVAERLRVAISQPPIDDTAVTVSLGVAVSEPGEAFSYATLFARADAALYEAKRAGRDRVRLAVDGLGVSDNADARLAV